MKINAVIHTIGVLCETLCRLKMFTFATESYIEASDELMRTPRVSYINLAASAL